MSRYIDAVKFEKYILDRYNTMEMVGINQVVNFIHEQPTADVKEVMRGEWRPLHSHFSPIRPSYGCSNCKSYNDFKSNFCPYCGADMREVEENA